MSAVSGISITYLIFLIAILGLSMYALVLFIKLARRGIKALDIHIEEKTNSR